MELLGRITRLRVTREAPPGFYVDGFDRGEILLPHRYVPEGTRPGSEVDVFVYRDSEDRLVATTEIPRIQAGQFGALKVIATNPQMGAFLDWGLGKDLLLPRREQGRPRRVGETVVVHVHVDAASDRIVASTRLHRWTQPHPIRFASEHLVELLVAEATPLGWKVIVEKNYLGQLYSNEVRETLVPGQTLSGYIRTVRPDGRVDVSPNRSGLGRLLPLGDFILQELEARGGNLPFHDGSSPDEIRSAFGVSKKAFKQALGALYRQRKIVVTETGIRRV